MTTDKQAAEFAALTHNLAVAYNAWDGIPAFYSIGRDTPTGTTHGENVHLLTGLDGQMIGALPAYLIGLAAEDMVLRDPGDCELVAFSFLCEAYTIEEGADRTPEIDALIQHGRLQAAPEAIQICTAMTVDATGRLYQAHKVRKTGEMREHDVDHRDGEDFRRILEALQISACVLPMARWLRGAKDPALPEEDATRRRDVVCAALADLIENPENAAANIVALLAQATRE